MLCPDGTLYLMRYHPRDGEMICPPPMAVCRRDVNSREIAFPGRETQFLGWRQKHLFPTS